MKTKSMSDYQLINYKVTIMSTGKLLIINKNFYDYLNKLPIPLRNRIYIMCSKQFWKDFVPITAKVPSWNASAIAQRQLLYNARSKNIHFLHLPCNTLEINKQYIMGCQCDYCISSTISVKYLELKDTLYNDYFYRHIPNTMTRWNDIFDIYYNPDTMTIKIGFTTFNPSYEEENLESTIQNIPIEFSS